MFAKLAVLLTAAVALSVSASPLGIHNSCNTGPVQCCGTLAAPTSAAATGILSLVGVAVQGLTGVVGAQCSPITVIGAGTGANCATTPVCCEKNFYNQLVGVNCSPVGVQV